MDIEDMKRPELQEKFRDVKSAGDILAIAAEEGIELTDDQLDGIAGGEWYDSASSTSVECPWCGSTDVTHLGANSQGNPHGGDSWQCNSCESIFDY